MMMLRTLAFCALFAGAATAQPIDISDHVAEAGRDNATTAVVVQRLSDGQLWSSNFARADTRFQPASSSKIPHTLIALETGFATPETTFEWDGQERFIESWNQDQTLTNAFQRSVVWVYQRVTVGLGGDTMAQWLKDFDYGNAEIGGPEALENYWLRGPLAISATEQVAFLSRLAQEDLPLSPATYTAAREIMLAETQGSARLYAKTGYNLREGHDDLGWYVGWVDNGQDIFVFAVNMDLTQFSDAPQRQQLARHILASLDIFPQPQ